MGPDGVGWAGWAGMGQHGAGWGRMWAGWGRMGQDGAGWGRMGQDGAGDGAGWGRMGLERRKIKNMKTLHFSDFISLPVLNVLNLLI